MQENSDPMSVETYNEISRRLREELPHVKDDVDRLIQEIFPQVRFIDIWVRPDRSWYGDEVVDIWAVYDAEAADLIHTRARLSFRTRVQDALWDRRLKVFPSTHFVTKTDIGDWRPEGI